MRQSTTDEYDSSRSHFARCALLYPPIPSWALRALRQTNLLRVRCIAERFRDLRKFSHRSLSFTYRRFGLCSPQAAKKATSGIIFPFAPLREIFRLLVAALPRRAFVVKPPGLLGLRSCRARIFALFAVQILFLAGADAATLQLSWVDNSNNEDGFNVERKVAIGGTYPRIATVGTNITYYADTNLTDGTAFCYRVNAFNTAGTSAYSAEVCGTAQDAQPANLAIPIDSGGSVTQSGSSATGSGAEIECGTACAAGIGTSVTSGPVRKNGKSLASRNSQGACAGSPGSKPCAPRSGAKNTTTPNLALSVQVISAIESGGSGAGKVVSQPNGINCGSKCSATYRSNVVVRLRAIPRNGSMFTGWSGDSDCADGSVTMTRDIFCSAIFQPITHVLSVSLSGSGIGKVTSDLSGIDCGASCVARFAKGARLKLQAVPDSDSLFSGWSGDRQCHRGTVTLKDDQSCTAVFTRRVPSKIGIYRPSAGEWYLTTERSGAWHGCDVDRCLGPIGDLGNLPVTGDWDGGGKSKLGIYNPEQNTWILDVETREIAQACPAACKYFTVPGTSVGPQLPIVGSWDRSGKYLLGIYQLGPNRSDTKLAHRTERGGNAAAKGHSGYWYLDRNGNGNWDGCNIDFCLGPFGKAGDIPVVGDWNGDGASKIGVFNPSSGMWNLDHNGNGKWSGCHTDSCLGPFGLQGDIPAVGDWDGSGPSKIGVFRPATGEWFLDANGNGQWDGCNIDKCLSGFGQEGDLPVVGKW